MIGKIKSVDTVKNKLKVESFDNLSEKQEKKLKIIFEKKVDIELLSFCEDRYEYNMHFSFIEKYHLTEEEFGLLKRGIPNE